MITEVDIIKAYSRIRTIDNTIPDDVLDFMKDASIKQLTLTDVSHSKVFEAYGKPFTSGRDLWDWLKDNCEIRIKT